MSSTELTELRDRIAAAFGGDVFQHQESIGTGFWLSTGREVGVRVTLHVTGSVQLTDGGDTWGELMNDGYVERLPTVSERDRVHTTAASFGVNVEADMTLSVLASAENVADAVRRVLMASVSIGSVVRVLANERVIRSIAHRRELVESVSRIAAREGWQASTTTHIRGASGHEWPCNVRLENNKNQRSAAVHITHDQANRIIERALGWRTDLTSGLVIVTESRRVEKINALVIQGVRAVPDDASDTDVRIFRAANDLAA